MNSIRVVPVEGLFNIDTGKLIGLRQQGAPADRESATPVMSEFNPLTGRIEGEVEGVEFALMTPEEIATATASATPRIRWVFGDASTAATVAVGTPVVSYADDIGGLEQGSVVFVSTGGTLAIEAQTSADGEAWGSIGVLGDGLSSGAHAFRLDSMPRDRFIRYVLTAGGTNCAVRAFSMWNNACDSIRARQILRNVAGDSTVAVSMSAGATITSPPIDLRRAVLDKSVLRVVVGSGTVKVSAQVSRDGIRDMFPLGDLKTGLTTGAYDIPLSDLAQYGLFLTVAITETAGATASVRSTASLSVADSFARNPGRKVAVVGARQMFEGANWTNNFNGACMSMYSLLDRMGYDAEIVPLDDASTGFDSGALRYEFAVLPFTNHGGYWTTWTTGAGKPISRLMKGKTSIPFFAVGVTSNNNALLAANLGAGVCDTATNRKIIWRGAAFYMPSVSAYEVVQQSHMAQYSPVVTDSNGGVTAWRFRGEIGWVYVGAGYNHPGDCNTFPVLLAEAIRSGHVAPPPRKATAVIDIDDFPASDGINGVMPISDMDRVYSSMFQMNMPCAFGIRPEDIKAGRQGVEMNEWLATRTADKGGLAYPIAHNGNWLWKTGTKVEKDALFSADIETINSAGIPCGSDPHGKNAWGYMYFNNNASDELTMQLGQSGADFTSSADNRSVSNGYGWRVARLDNLGGNNSDSIGEPIEVQASCWYRGIRLVGSHLHMGASALTVDFDDGAAGSGIAALQCARFIRHGLCYGSPFYFHGQNCYQVGGNAPGSQWLEVLAGLYSAGLSEVVEFVHGSRLAYEI